MKLTVLGSSSAGNSYILTSDTGEVLLLECGIRFSEVKKALDFNISNIVGCLVTHRHGDHSKYVKSYLDAGIKVYTSTETIKGTKISSHNWMHLMAKVTVHVGDWSFKGMDVKHDVQNFAYYITHRDNKIIFITDCYFIPFKASGLTNIIIEANFSDEILNESGTIEIVRKRVVTSHLSLDLCKDWLVNNDLTSVNNIVLIHLSERNSHEQHFKNVIQGATGKPVSVATPGMSINFAARPF